MSGFACPGLRTAPQLQFLPAPLPGLVSLRVPRPSSAAGLGAGTREQDPDGSSVVHPWTLLGLRGKRSLLVGAVAIEYFWEVTGGHRWGGPAKEQADTGKQPPREP